MIKEKTYCIANDFTAYQIYIYIYIYIYWRFYYLLEGDFVKLWEWFVGGSLRGNMRADVYFGKKVLGRTTRTP